MDAAPRLPSGALDYRRRRAIGAAWGHYAGHGEALFAAPEAVAAPGANGPPAVAFDPQSDRALAAWVVGRDPARRLRPAHRRSAADGAALPAAQGRRARQRGADGRLWRRSAHRWPARAAGRAMRASSGNGGARNVPSLPRAMATAR